MTDPTSTIPRPTGSSASPPRVVSIRVAPSAFTLNPDSVRLYHRTMFGPESLLTLRDDGVPPDATANDGIFSGLLPTGNPAPGEMLRWRFEAADIHRNGSRSPPFADPADSDEYHGTVALNPDEDSSQLTILHQFIQNPDAAGTLSGTYSSIYYLDRFTTGYSSTATARAPRASARKAITSTSIVAIDSPGTPTPRAR